ncbi:MAG: CRTAC1 family protein [Planctomycetes bacterium]|nr:CRTAC1 family protein [Planctomycetota bacterium]
MATFSRRLLASAACLIAAAASRGQEPAPPPCCATPSPALAPLPTNATAKEAWLRRIHDGAATDRSNVYLSPSYIDELRQRLAATEGKPMPAERSRRLWELAQATLSIGAVDETIRLLEECVRIAETDPQTGPAMLPESLFRLAVAHFRDAEKKNCIANHNVDSCILPLSPRAVHVHRDGATAARAALERLLALPQDHLRLEAIWLLNITHMALGSWPDSVPQPYRIAPERYGAEAPFPRFVDVARDVGLARHGHAGSVVIDDFTGDGRLDVVTVKFDTDQSVQLHRNEGDGRFTDVTAEAGLSLQLGGINVVQADVDGDGLLDLLVLRGGGFSARAEHPNSLLRQDRPGHFVDVTADAGIEIAAPTRTAAFADWDLDGDLDLFLGYESETVYLDAETGANAREQYPSRMFRNDGTGRFEDVTAASGVRNPHYCAGAVFGDVDGDRYPDLFVSNFMGPNRLFVNQRDGTFRDAAKVHRISGTRESGPAGFVDYDNDGDLDLFVTACRHLLQIQSIAAAHVHGAVSGPTQALYENDGKGAFLDVSEPRGLRRVLTASSLNFGDVDNDGSVDLYIGTGAHDFAALFPNVLLLGGERFRDATTAAGVGHLQKCYGVACADLDDDGDLDLSLSVGGFHPDDEFSDVLFRNPGNDHHWLSVQLRGVTDNRFGIGARVHARVVGPAGERSVYQTIGMGASFGGNPLRAHLGLGRADRILFVEVLWPASGRTQRIEEVPLDASIRIAQDRPGFERLERTPFRLGR